MLLLGFRHDGSGPEILVTKRTETVDTHKGQYALPGGRLDPEDELDRGLVTTALRETEEEVGISPRMIEVLGELPYLWTPSGHVITPIVGLLLEPIDEVTLVPSEAEIDLVFWVSLHRLNAPGVYSEEPRMIGAVSYKTDVFQVDEHKIWGATGAMLKNLIQRLERLG